MVFDKVVAERLGLFSSTEEPIFRCVLLREVRVGDDKRGLNRRVRGIVLNLFLQNSTRQKKN